MFGVTHKILFSFNIQNILFLLVKSNNIPFIIFPFSHTNKCQRSEAKAGSDTSRTSLVLILAFFQHMFEALV